MDGSLEAFLYSENGGEDRIRTYGPIIETARIGKPARLGHSPTLSRERLPVAFIKSKLSADVSRDRRTGRCQDAKSLKLQDLLLQNLTLDFFLVGINCLPVADTNQMKSVVRPESGRISAADNARGFPRA